MAVEPLAGELEKSDPHSPDNPALEALLQRPLRPSPALTPGPGRAPRTRGSSEAPHERQNASPAPAAAPQLRASVGTAQR